MSAVWRASRAAVKRRRFQTFVLGVVVMVSSAMAIATLGLLAAVSGPFDRAYDAANGAHVVAEFDSSKVTAAQLDRAAKAPGVEAAAGPYPVAVLHSPSETGDHPIGMSGSFTVVGRDRPDTPVDTLGLSAGRWPSGPGEIVLNAPASLGRMEIRSEHEVVTPDGVRLKVVGYASSASRSAGGWVAPDQARALGAASFQMMYRFEDAGSESALKAGTAAATEGLPSDALTGTGSYLALKAELAKGPNTYVPFLTVFGVLGLIVSVLIVGNVVSGAVVSGFRHIGVLKALGFTPNQVTAVYLVMVTVPAVIGSVLGSVVGGLVGRKLVRQAFFGIFGNDLVVDGATVPSWVHPVVLVGMPVLVALSALVPALRARRLPAAVAISAGGAPRTGRGLAVQRRLGGPRLPRPVSLGLGWPFTRPGRTALTLSTVVLGVMTVTMALGVSASVVEFGKLRDQTDRVQVRVDLNNPKWNQPGPTHSDAELFALLRALPGTAHVSARSVAETRMAGSPDIVRVGVESGDTAELHPDLVRGRWIEGPNEIVVSSEFWHRHKVSLGDTITLDTSDGPQPQKIVGETTEGWDVTTLDWDRFVPLTPVQRAQGFSVQLTKGTDAQGYATAAAGTDPGLNASVNGASDTVEKVIIGVVSTLTLMLVLVSGLGVFNTVLLNTRERRKDLGMLKSIGMTPRQVIAMTVTSVAAIGAVGGIVGAPLGMLAHRIVVPLTGRGTGLDLPDSLLQVWSWPTVALLVLSGPVIAALGAYLPSRGAARAPVAEVLRTE
ncbi:ABC transporter permease [Kitasatospora purpeofusca]|uniref:ABC transporter permease n=1 Tax=Kitasatospora purpeofusca TaxID=67352 RepID=UPI002258BA81|nr:FtsX-like permease family protein [Kitasatospora purpeofusca]MCX4754209.1 FtsX-like permease family protein [Kitasatospora purpeofusca]